MFGHKKTYREHSSLEQRQNELVFAMQAAREMQTLVFGPPILLVFRLDSNSNRFVNQLASSVLERSRRGLDPGLAGYFNPSLASRKSQPQRNKNSRSATKRAHRANRQQRWSTKRTGG